MRQSVAEAAWHVRHRARVRGAARRPARDDRGRRRPRARVRGRDAHGDAARARVRRRRGCLASRRSAASRPPCRSTGCASAGRGHAYEALECLGGNGYTEAFPLARRYREQPLMAIWEGSGNVIALDVLRVLAREPEAFEAFFDASAPLLATPVARAPCSTARSPSRHRSCESSRRRMPRPPPPAPASSPSASRSCCRLPSCCEHAPRRGRRRVRAHPPRRRGRTPIRRAAARRRHGGDPRKGVSSRLRDAHRTDHSKPNSGGKASTMIAAQPR